MSTNLWKDSFRIGNAEIDAQHHMLFEKIEYLVDIAKSGDAETKRQECLETIDFLVFYTTKHFEAEEALMKKVSYVSFEQHANIHAQFKNTAAAYQKKLREDYSEHALQYFIGTLMTWLVTHVCGCDQKIMRNDHLQPDFSATKSGEVIPAVLKHIFTDMYGIQIQKVTPCMYKGFVDGKVFVYTTAEGEQKYSFVYGMSEELAKKLYNAISGMDILDIDQLNPIEQSALMEMSDIISSYILCADDANTLSKLKMQHTIIMDEFTMENLKFKSNLLLNIQTDCGTLEVLCGYPQETVKGTL